MSRVRVTWVLVILALVCLALAVPMTADAQQDPTTTTGPAATVATTAPPSTAAPTTTTPSTTVVPSTTSPPTTAPVTTAPSATTAPSTTLPDVGPGVGAEALPPGSATQVFTRGFDGALWWRQQSGSGWSAWQSFGGQITGLPSAAVGLNGWLYVFGRGTDGALWWQGYFNGSWTGWKSLGGSLTSDPVAYGDASGVNVFVRSSDNALWWGAIDAGGWRGWRSAGGSVLSGPAVAGNASGRYAFVVGAADGGVWVNRWSAGVPTGWVSLGGAPSLDLAAAVDSSGLAVYARGSVNALYRRRLSGTAFLPWESLGGHITSSPAAVGSGATTSLFARGLDNALWVQTLTSGGPGVWQSLGGAVTSDPGATVDATGTEVFVRGNNLQLWGQRNEGSWSGWYGLGGVPMLSEPFALSTPVLTAAPPPPPTGRGFDACEAPTTSQMQTWRLASPYTSAGVYIGGINRACPNAAFNSSAWVNTVVAQGWRLIPIYVGLQAPCISFTSQQLSRNLGTASAQGAAAAEDAAARAAGAGIGPGAPIYFDMEAYNSADAGCVAAVRAFISSWVGQLHVRGYKAGMYSSLCSGIIDQAAVYDDPNYQRLDAIWFAAWPYADGNDPRYANYNPALFGTSGCGAALTDNMWPFHQRIRQYRQAHNETYGGVTINIDTNNVDGPLAP